MALTDELGRRYFDLMRPGRAKKVLGNVVAGTTILILCGVMGVFGLRAFIDREVAATGERAMQRFSGDRTEALMNLVACDDCSLHERNRAIWALGQMGNRRALPVLRRYHTWAECDHAVTLCQYELGKAIKKIEGTWDLHASFWYHGTEATSK